MRFRSFVFSAVLFALLTAVQPVRAQDAARLVGVWHCQTAFDGFPALVETILQANGSFSGMLRSQTGFMSRHWGKYTVGDGFIRFEYDGHEPRQYCGPLGCQDLHLPEGETTLFRFLDDTHIETRPSVCAFPPCSCVHTKVQ